MALSALPLPRPAPAFPEGPGVESDLAVGGMHCAACAGKVRSGLLALKGVEAAVVSPGLRRVRVRWRPQVVGLAQMHAAIRQAGYTPLAEGGLALHDARQAQSRAAMWRWLVAALCMMQVMMYAYPAYVAEAGTLSADQSRLLRLASWALTLPVLLFSCAPIWRQAWADTLQGRIGMDTPVALGLAVTFAVSSVATFEPDSIWGAEVYFDSLTMFVFFLLSARWLESRLRDRTAGALDALASQLPQTAVRVQRAGAAGPLAQPEQVLLADLQVGDRVQVLPGQVIAADGVVESGRTQVNEALLTGEALPLLRGPGDAVVAGSGNLSGAVTVRITGLGADTRFAHIARLMESAALTRPRVVALADRVATPFLVAVVVLAAGVAVWHWPTDPARALMLAVTVLIVTCPCALSLAAPAALIAASGSLARRGVLVQDLGALEALATADTVVFDKTGTLTQDRLELSHMEASRRVGRTRALDLAALLANHSLHPAAKALQRPQPTPESGANLRGSRFEEVAGSGVRGEIEVDGKARPFRLGSAAFCGVGRGDGSASGAGLTVHLADDAGWLASFSLTEALRPDARQAVTDLQGLGIRVELLSGDRPAAVQELAKGLGLDAVQGGCTPQGKLAHVTALQRSGHRVVMVGDGLNDGPALSGATVSAAMGHAVDLSKARASFILQGDALQAIPTLVGTARQTLLVVRQNLAWAAAYNLVCVPLAVLGVFSPWAAGLGMAASSLLVAANAARLAVRE